jgi:predicted nuclease with RNAse H fold
MEAAMKTVGIDLAAQPKNTGICLVEWTGDEARILSAEANVSDSSILDLIEAADVSGIDAPLGWPDAFVEFIASQHKDEFTAVAGDQDEWRRNLAFRLTDLVITRDEELKARPLSVSTNLIAYPAFRAAALLAQVRDRGIPVDRSGAGRIVEVYPAAALKVWRQRYQSYKGRTGVIMRAIMLDDIKESAPWLNTNGFEADLVKSDHVLDALICAFVARAAATGRGTQPTDDQRARARREGWIVVPTCHFSELV